MRTRLALETIPFSGDCTKYEDITPGREYEIDRNTTMCFSSTSSLKIGVSSFSKFYASVWNPSKNAYDEPVQLESLGLDSVAVPDFNQPAYIKVKTDENFALKFSNRLLRLSNKYSKHYYASMDAVDGLELKDTGDEYVGVTYIMDGMDYTVTFENNPSTYNVTSGFTVLTSPHKVKVGKAERRFDTYQVDCTEQNKKCRVKITIGDYDCSQDQSKCRSSPLLGTISAESRIFSFDDEIYRTSPLDSGSKKVLAIIISILIIICIIIAVGVVLCCNFCLCCAACCCYSCCHCRKDTKSSGSGTTA